MERVDQIELKFRLFDGSDIGPDKYDPSTTVGSLKETILARWPAVLVSAIQNVWWTKIEGFCWKSKRFLGKEIAPKSINDVKLINAGKILENNRTLAELRVPVGELPCGIITMHVVVRPPMVDKSNEKHLAKASKPNSCACTIL